MKLLVTIAYLSLIFTVVFSVTQSNNNDEDDDDKKMAKFKEFKKQNRRRYSGALETVHFKRWKRRESAIKRHNKITSLGYSSFQMIDNQFSDQSEEEWDTYLLGVSVPEEFVRSPEQVIDMATHPQEEPNVFRQILTFDLRTNPCMPPIKTQSPCGGCWAFIATTIVEYQTCIRNRNRTALILSEQQLIDCSGSYGTKGCNGGFYTQAWDYIMAVGGQTTNSIYPFKAETGTCAFTRGITPVMGNISRYVYLARNETSILSALQRGPIAVSIVANSRFILYSSGIFDDESCRNGTVNHGVILVGYGQINGTDYWIARNSWGTSWGQNGHIFLKRNVNICRIAEFAFLATP